MSADVLIVGSRESRLALLQTRSVIEALRLKVATKIELRIIKTQGDRPRESASPQALEAGVFVKELQKALLVTDIDIAVHSLKDLPVAEPEGLEIACCPRREDPHDMLVSHSGAGLFALPKGARVGTTSPRRRAQLLRARPDLEVVPVRGNVDTRISKMRRGELDAVVLAAAGLTRLRMMDVSTPIPFEVMLPAPGQGALALETRKDDEKAKAWVGHIDDEVTRQCVAAERQVLWALGGGCRMPLGILAHVDDVGRLNLWARLLSPDGNRQAEVKLVGDAREPLVLAEQAATELKGQTKSILFS